MSKIHVCYGFHDSDGHYSKFAGTSMLSMFENTKEDIVVHILHDNTLTEDNRNKFNDIAKRYDQQVIFYNLEVLIPDKIEEIKKRIPDISNHRLGVGATYRLMISSVIPNDIDRVIYLDSGDTIVHRDIKDLWNIDVFNYPLAAVTESTIGTPYPYNPVCRDGFVEPENYFNSGVLLLNLGRLRKAPNIFEAGIKFRGEHPGYITLDQTILNYCFSTNYLKLTKDFNTYVCWQRRDNIYKIENVIYHYNSSPLGIGINLNTSDVYSHLYLEYFSKTPWFNVDMLGNLFKSICQLCNEKQGLAIQITKLLAGKGRAFFADQRDLEALEKIFGITSNEVTITATMPPDQSVHLLLSSMKKSKSKKLFFIFVVYYDNLRDFLIKQGFIEGRDFINGNVFFQKNPQQDSYFLVRAM